MAFLVLVALSVLWYYYPDAWPFQVFYYWWVDNHLQCMTPEIKNSIVSITIVEELGKSKNGKIIGGFCDPSGNIFFMRSAVILEPSIVYHEATHALHYKLYRQNSDFCSRWQSIVGGELTDYGMTGDWEDVAEWVREIYKDIYSNFIPTEFDRRWTEEETGSYRQKLQLLREYKFISEGDYQKIIEMHPELRNEFSYIAPALVGAFYFGIGAFDKS